MTVLNTDCHHLLGVILVVNGCKVHRDPALRGGLGSISGTFPSLQTSSPPRSSPCSPPRPPPPSCPVRPPTSPLPHFPIPSGHLNSLTKLLTMYGSTAHFNPVTGASAEANLEAIHLFTGGVGVWGGCAETPGGRVQKPGQRDLGLD